MNAKDGKPVGTSFWRAAGALLVPEPRTKSWEKTDIMETTDNQYQKCTVLAIDDDQQFLDSVRLLLKPEGFYVLTANSGMKGLNMLRYAPLEVQAVLLDYNMPSLNGAQTLEHLRKISPRVKVLAVTGVKAELLPPAFRAGVDRLLSKPFKTGELIDSLRELLNGGFSRSTVIA